MRNLFWFLAGLVFLALSKAKHLLLGYTAPKPFSDYERCIAYDLEVAAYWIRHLSNMGVDIRGKNVLELGPGSDLGAGIKLLSLGAAQFSAFDANDLNEPSFNHVFAARIDWPINKTKLKYIVREDFDLVKAFPSKLIDITVSYAAFEHFNDMDQVISGLTQVSKPGAILVALVDLRTHSRWIRKRDVNNIYRYPDWLYNLFWFPGRPSRLRPYQYREILERHGWTVNFPSASADGNTSGLAKRFRGQVNQMGIGGLTICAVKQ